MSKSMKIFLCMEYYFNIHTHSLSHGKYHCYIQFQLRLSLQFQLRLLLEFASYDATKCSSVKALLLAIHCSCFIGGLRGYWFIG